MRRLRSLPYLQAFEAAARLGSVTAAANELNITPSAASQQIHKLQGMLHANLFTREGRKLKLTPIGQALSRKVANILAQIQENVDDFAPSLVHEGRSFTISVPPALAISWLMPLMFDFTESVGLRSWHMFSAVEFAQVNWRKVEAAIVYGNPPWKGFVWHLISKVELGPVCSPALMNMGRPLRAPKDILAHCLLHENDLGEWQRWMNTAGISDVASRNAYFGSLTMALTAAVEGKGVALVGDLPVQDYVRSGRLMRPFPMRIEASNSYYCVCPEERSSEPLVRQFFDKVIAKATGIHDSKRSPI